MRARWSAMAAPAGTVLAVAASVLAVSAAGTAGGGAPRSIRHPSWAASGAPVAPLVTAGRAGYVAAGRRFRYAQAVIIPGRPCRAGNGQPRLYVALAGPRGYARAGLSCQAGGAGTGPRARPGWRAVGSVALASGRLVTKTFPLGGLRPGEGVFVSVYFSRAARSVRVSVTAPDGASYIWPVTAGATFYGQAQALADWTGSAPDAPPPLARATREAWFGSGGFTTAHGTQGTFTGPWLLTRWETASTRKPAARPAAAPGYLTADGTQRVIGSWDDAFGIWLYR